MRRGRVIICGVLGAVACAAGADPADARPRSCGTDAPVPAALSDRYALLRAPARRSDALPRGADCRLGKLHTLRQSVRLLARHRDGSRTYFLAAYEGRDASGFTGLSACVATLRPRGRRYEDTGGCAAMPLDARGLPATTWFHDGRRTIAALPDGVARVRIHRDGRPVRELAVERNAVVLAGSAPLGLEWLAADGSVLTQTDAPFVCEDPAGS